MKFLRISKQGKAVFRINEHREEYDEDYVIRRYYAREKKGDFLSLQIAAEYKKALIAWNKKSEVRP